MSKRFKVAGLSAGMVILVAAAGGLIMHKQMMAANPVPPASEFGNGPRKSAAGNFSATLEETAPFKTGRMLNTVVCITDAAGNPLTGASITVDGGMPQHGHGLPTQPRVTQELEGGRYQIAGLKFNMGGWWELKFRITHGSTSDIVTFNLKL